MPTVNSLVFDHTSVLKLIEWRWVLEPLTPDGASMDANNLAYAMSFANPGNSRTVFAQTAHTADRDALFSGPFRRPLQL